MAFNLGRPALFAAEDTITHARRFLEHPLAIRTDSRLVATCQLLTHRLPLHQPFSIWPAATRIPDLDGRIESANAAYVAWFNEWDAYYEGREPKSSFLRESLTTQYSHALLHTNSRILHGVRSRRDMAHLSEHRAQWLRQALASAQTLVEMALRGEAYATNFAKANYYTHIGVAFAARMVIRLTSLMPDAVDLRQTGRDLEAVTKILAKGEYNAVQADASAGLPVRAADPGRAAPRAPPPCAAARVARLADQRQRAPPRHAGDRDHARRASARLLPRRAAVWGRGRGRRAAGRDARARRLVPVPPARV